MFVRRSGALALALALALAAGCKDVSQRAPAPTIVIATFSSPNIPTPNDLALQATPTLTDPALAAQKDLLQSFVDQGGFPADQAPTLSVPIRALDWDDATSTYVPRCKASPCDPKTLPSVDATTITSTTAALFKVDENPPRQIAVEPAFQQQPGSISFVPAKDPLGSRRLPAGRYVFAVRGGASGVRTTDQLPVDADLPIALTIPNKDLTNRENQPPGGLSPAQLAQLVAVQGLLWNPVGWVPANPGTGNVWIPCVPPAVTPSSPDPLKVACTKANAAVKSSAYAAIDPAFPHTDVASIAAFQIAASTATVPLVDAASGQAPLPIDLLRTGDKGTIAANPAFGAAGAGLVTLDGFSTTAMMLAPTSLPVDASTVHGGNVFLFKLGTTPTEVLELKAALGTGGQTAARAARYVAQPDALQIPQGKNILPGSPCPIAGKCSPAIGLQPAVPVGADQAPGGPYFLPPLDENTSYAVVITNRVKDIAGHALGRPTIMTLLTETHPVAVSGQSLVGGIDNTTATAIETMRGQLAPVLSAVPGGASTVALAYTFKTQSFKETSLSLAAAPYGIEKGTSQAIFTPTAATAVTSAPAIPGVAAVYDVTFKSVDAIDKSTGALRPTLSADLQNPAVAGTLLTDLHALVAVPAITAVPACSPPFPAEARCAPLVVFGHGLNSSKESMLAVAGSLAAHGFVVAAIDFPLHGSRNWCSQNSDCQVAGGGAGTCTPFPGAAGQGDAAPPGECTGGSSPVAAPSRYFIGANFFRTRDAFRQNLFDVGALVLALDRPPGTPTPGGNPFTALLPNGLLVNPLSVYYEGLSLGSLAGTGVLAANSRMSRGALSVGGGTIADFFTRAPAFQAQVVQLFTALLAGPLQGRTFSFDMIDPTSDKFDLLVAEGYLQTLNVAKWILDPSEPVNYAVNVVDEPLPNLLAKPDGSVLQLPKAAYAQIAQNDPVIPNPFNLLLDTLMGADQTFYTGGNATHSMLATVGQVQIDAAGFLADPSAPPPATRNLGP